MGIWLRAAALGVSAAAIMPLAGFAASEKPVTDDIAGLVRDLGSEEFATREKATRRLLELGIATRDALLAAAADADAEVRARARAILATVSESDFRDRLEAFSADFDGRQKQTLPAW